MSFVIVLIGQCWIYNCAFADKHSRYFVCRLQPSDSTLVLVCCTCLGSLEVL